jgi:branched-chain amino acid aminotransferase
MENSLGVKSPSASMLVLMASPVGPYYPTGFKPISLSCSLNSIRSAPGGTGYYKVGGYKWLYLETMDLL